ncbi:MAG: peptidylprolyl isomerase [Halobacteriaceae archaeon]
MAIEDGDRVRLALVGRFEDGPVFARAGSDSPESTATEASTLSDESPVTFRVGHGEVISGLEDAVRGLEEGAERSVTVPPEEAYGPRQPDRIREYDPATFEAMTGMEPDVGRHVEANNGLHGDVTAVSEQRVEVDFNHELAGHTLVFEFTVLSVSKRESEG